MKNNRAKPVRKHDQLQFFSWSDSKWRKTIWPNLPSEKNESLSSPFSFGPLLLLALYPYALQICTLAYIYFTTLLINYNIQLGILLEINWNLAVCCLIKKPSCTYFIIYISKAYLSNSFLWYFRKWLKCSIILRYYWHFCTGQQNTFFCKKLWVSRNVKIDRWCLCLCILGRSICFSFFPFSLFLKMYF